MSKRFYLTAAALLAAASLAGCASTSQYDQGFGQSVRASIASQVINPAAAANINPVTGIDAGAALGAQARYEQSFTRPSNDQPGMITGNVK